jgi:hypothetical protein
MNTDFILKSRRLVNLAIWLWLAVWIVLLGKALIGNRAATRETLQLLWEAQEARQRQSYGEELYEFSQLCRRTLPETARFEIVGLERGSQDHSRLVYLLYPRVLSEQPEYLLVYQSPLYGRPDSHRLASLGDGNFILRIGNKDAP